MACSLLKPIWRQCLLALGIFFLTALVGARIFQAVEGDGELQRAQEFQAQQKERLQVVESKLAGLVSDEGALGNLTALVAALEQYAYSKQQAPNPDSLHWTFRGSLFFVVTIMTTLGYGTFVPYTAAGEVLVVVFGFFGLAISGLCITVLTNGFDAALASVGEKVGALTFLRKSQGAKFRGGRALFCGALGLGFWVLSACIFSATESWSFATAFYYSFVTFTTIGFGHYAISYGDGAGAGLAAWIILTLVGMIVLAKAVSEVAVLTQTVSDDAVAQVEAIVTSLEKSGPLTADTEAPLASACAKDAAKRGVCEANDSKEVHI